MRQNEKEIKLNNQVLLDFQQNAARTILKYYRNYKSKKFVKKQTRYSDIETFFINVKNIHSFNNTVEVN